ncbi:MAG TPA: hypothetical protein VE398_20470 [Acidobacteriota bacterium]|nr:hypothetical protein [Acidobacteriota bacterium]
MKQKPDESKRTLPDTQYNITGEAKYIIGRAKHHDSRVVRLGQLVFFSTEKGDAWILDPEDELALCLARDGAAQKVKITETARNCSIEWNCGYEIEGDFFVVTEKFGRTKSIFGYPTAEIKRLSRRIKRE